MEEKIINYALEHPVLFSIIVPIVLGVVVSFFIEILKYIIFGVRTEEEAEERNTIDNIVWRITTVVLSFSVAVFTLMSINGVLESFSLKALFVIINTSVPFMFYHLKGKELIRGTIGKLFDKFQKTQL